MCIMLIIAIKTFQDDWNLLVPGSYTSSTTRIQFSTSSPLKVSLENCRWFLSVKPEPFRTACAITFQMRPATAGLVPGTDAGCGLSTRGHWDGPAICNESQWGSRHCETLSATWLLYYINYGYYINYFNWNEISDISDIIKKIIEII